MSMNKDPDAVLDYGIRWDQWLADGETISTSTWIVPDGITKNSDSHDTTTTTIWLAGGTAGTSYKLTNRITTSESRTDDRSLTIRVANR